MQAPFKLNAVVKIFMGSCRMGVISIQLTVETWEKEKGNLVLLFPGECFKYVRCKGIDTTFSKPRSVQDFTQ